MVNLASTFSNMPNVTQLDDLPDAWHWSMAPGFDFSAALSGDSGHAFQAYALDSYDEALAVAVLTFAREHGSESIAPPQRPLVVVEGFAHPGYLFDTLVAVGPTVHKYHAKEDPEAHEATRAVFPAYRCEFAGDETQEEAQYRYARAAGVPATRWNREPRPYLKMRYRTETGREIPERGFAALTTFVHELRGLVGSQDRFVEFENYRHQVWRVGWDGTWIVSSESAETRRLGIDELLEFAKSALYGPNLAAGDSEFTKEL